MLCLWDRVCNSSFQVEFTDQLYESSLLVIFSSLVCRSSSQVDFIEKCTGLVYGRYELGLQIEITGLVL